MQLPNPIHFWVKAKYDWTPDLHDYPQVPIKAGDAIIVMSVGEQSGWWQGRVVRLGEGAPKSAIPRNFVTQLPVGEEGRERDNGVLFYVKALFDASSSGLDDILFKEGDVIGVTAAPDDGWWSGILLDASRQTRERTLFPRNFVEGILPPGAQGAANAGAGDEADAMPILFYALATNDRAADDAEELSISAEDVIAIVEMPGDGWWRGFHVDPSKRLAGGPLSVPVTYLTIF